MLLLKALRADREQLQSHTKLIVAMVTLPALHVGQRSQDRIRAQMQSKDEAMGSVRHSLRYGINRPMWHQGEAPCFTKHAPWFYHVYHMFIS